MQAAVKSRRDEVPPVPNSSPGGTLSPAVTLAGTTRAASRLKRPKPAPSDPFSPNSSENQGSPSGTVQTPTASPLDLLVERFPRLLALSLALSARFEHDPSPHGVAEVFAAMEEEITTETAHWASEVGNLGAMGMGELLDQTEGHRRSKSSSGSGDEGVTKGDPDWRLSFADIVSAEPSVDMTS